MRTDIRTIGRDFNKLRDLEKMRRGVEGICIVVEKMVRDLERMPGNIEEEKKHKKE